ncbi:hypothetical protein H4219_000619 [Mycoemilia scoparia]|uniref:Uncharacterized protein n=1 Tax=Mycoemilia scoparia TaxID=417184 RepID=A0A9W8A2L5_9FUNG|nr:hypothetical protein H4219_000619 [Mycoemilia scoparia]
MIQTASNDGTEQNALKSKFLGIESQMKGMLGKIAAGRVVEAFDILSRVTDALVTNCESLGLTSDKPIFEGFDRIKFWRTINQCWMYAIRNADTATSSEQRLREEHFEHLRKSIVMWCDVLQKYGLVDYDMGFSETLITGLLVDAQSKLVNQKASDVEPKK